MKTIEATALVIAKAPVAGFAKTRLSPPFSATEAAQLAAASLLDTLAAVRRSGTRHRFVAWTGDLERAERASELATELADFTLIRQCGNSFGHRLARAHRDAAEPGLPVLQIGMDTPQAGPALLAHAATRLLECGDAVLGPATDGGWWALGLTDPTAARTLTEVPMSTGSTGERTRIALRARGCRVQDLPTLSDVDTAADARTVAGECRGHFSSLLAQFCAPDSAAERAVITTGDAARHG